MEYETILVEYVDYGRNKFIEISKKRVVPENAVFINISKGYYTPTGAKRYQKGIGFPPEEEIVTGLIEKLGSIWSSVTPDDMNTIKAAEPSKEAGEQAPTEAEQEEEVSETDD